MIYDRLYLGPRPVGWRGSIGELEARIIEVAEIFRLRFGRQRNCTERSQFVIPRCTSIKCLPRHSKVHNKKSTSSKLARSITSHLTISQESRCRMTKTMSIGIEDLDLNHKESPHHTTILPHLKKRLKAFQKKWGPLMPAKEHLDDEYNFPPGRYAGQNDANIAQQW